MPLSMTPIAAGTNRKSRTPLEDIDPDVVQAVEEAYVYCATNDDQRLQVSFDSKELAEDFLREARAYAYQREAGRLVVVGNPAGKGKKAFARFRVDAFIPKDDDDDE